MSTFAVTPIGFVRSAVTVPRDDGWGNVIATILLDAGSVGPDATRGLEDFSHVDVLFLMHLVEPGDVERDARHPRNDERWPKVGILAQRAKRRTNRIGVTTCELLSVSRMELTVRGLDAVNGTPVLDLKPYMPGMGPRSQVRTPPWADELMAQYFSSDSGARES